MRATRAATSTRIAMVGAGRAATGLAGALKRRGYRITGFFARRRGSAVRAAAAIGLRGGVAGDLAALVRDADIVLLCVPDAEIPRVADALSRLPAPGVRGKVVMHTSGAVGASAIASLRQAGARVGCLHPLVSFPPGDAATFDLEGVAFAIGGDPAALRAGRALAKGVGGLPLAIADRDRAAYHLAATMVASGTAALLDVGIEIARRRLGLSRARAGAALTTLLASVLRNVKQDGASKGLTGPVSRGDIGTVGRHLASLRKEDSSVRELYRLLSLRAIEMSVADGRLGSSTAMKLRKKLAHD
ncbi:MAG TPA: Rossmann-like and DUF2520 domain-containing protein [Patescibacteria group bacterium]|nr:Rossmann-like and DUF2520 domain-containing protein [Patescibacteria group bacterium]